MLTAPFSAQYGQSGGGAILTTTKSGTDNFHGSAFEEYNSQKLTALGYFQCLRTTVLPPTSHLKLLRRLLVYGLGRFGFPGSSTDASVTFISLPTGKTRSTTLSPPSMPTFLPWPSATGTSPAHCLTGQCNLSETQTQLLSPLRALSAAPPFQGNMIPVSRRDAVGMSIVALYPMPEHRIVQVLSSTTCLNLTAHSSYLYNADRIDFNATDHDHIWAKFSRDGPRNQPVPEIPNAANNSAFNGWTDDHYEVSWSHIFSPRISNEARGGYVSEVNFSYPVATNAGSLGLQGVPLTYQFPTVQTSLFPNLGAGSYAQTRDGHYIVNDAMVLQLGRHSLSVGGEFMRYAYSYYTPGVLSGAYSFSGIYTNVTGQTGFGLPGP